jgi:NTE family protein
MRTPVLVLCCVGAFLAFLDATIVNIAFPAIEKAFKGPSLSTLSWVLNAYNVVIAASLVPAGRLADRLGRRRIFLIGLLLFTVASAACAAAPAVGWLIAARVLQAVGAAMLLPASLALMLPLYPPERRQAAAALWGAVAAVASGAGPTLGGVLIQWASWRWVFLINVPIGVVAAAATLKLLRESRSETPSTPDVLGAVLLAVALGALATGLVKGHEWGWGSARVLIAFAIAAAGFAAGALHAPRHPTPVLDPDVLRLRSVAVANVATILFATAFFAATLNNVLFLTGSWRWSELHAGLAITPTPLIAAVAAGPAGKIADRLGASAVIVPGTIIYLIGMLITHAIAPKGPDFWGHWLPGMVLIGTGVGLAFPALGGAALQGVADRAFGVASALNNTARTLGAVLGVSLLVVIFSAAGPDPAIGAKHAWIFAGVVAIACGAVSATLPRPGRRR